MGKVLLVVAAVAVVVYAVVWALERRRAGLPAWPRRTDAPPPRESAPDDDEDFLRWLDRRRKHDPEPPES